VTPAQIIRRKRDGEELTPADIRELFRGYTAGMVAEYQMSAFLMAVFFNGLSATELTELVNVMIGSGAVADLHSIPALKVDKHSSGGVGDKTSIIIAPLVAALGVPVPMMSGRGLGHTGGTLDKLEAIPGFRTDLTLQQYRAQIEKIGCSLIGQTQEVAPLDRRLYALRDVTATVESIPLIASSIMSKKLAEGIDALVLDVKTGNGAFLPDRERATHLARTMLDIGAGHGKKVVALITAMDRPLGFAVGNALEIEECVLTLHGEGPADLRELCLVLAAEMLVIGGAYDSLDEARMHAAAALDDGRAADKMREVIQAQGGNPSVLEDPAILPQAEVTCVIEADRDGYIGDMDVRAIGEAAVKLGAGRRTLGDEIDPSVGFHITIKPGDKVTKGQPMATIHARTPSNASKAAAALRAAMPVADEPGVCLPLIIERLTP